MSKKVWSVDEENYSSDSLSDLIRDYDLGAGAVVWSGIASHQSASMFFDGADLIECAQERAYDEYGDYAEKFLDGVSDEEKKSLDDFIAEWLKTNSNITFYMVSDTKKYKVTEKDIQEAGK